MTQNLELAINQIFSKLRDFSSSRFDYGYNGPLFDTVKYLEIPINKDVIEVPMFIFRKFRYALSHNLDTDAEAIAVRIETRNHISRYKSLERSMQDLLLDSYQSKLVRVPIENRDGTSIYFCTHGAVFSPVFEPLFLCSWQLQKIEEGNYKLLKPVIWMHPSVYTDNTDKMAKFLASKVVSYALSNSISVNYSDVTSSRILSYDRLYYPQVVIGKCPFVLRDMETPSISTTNEELLQIAIDHKDELIQ